MRIVIVSNRLPFSVAIQDGFPHFRASSGGLATGVWSCLEHSATDSAGPPDFLWLGWPGASVPARHQAAVTDYGQKAFKSVPVFLPEKSIDRFYRGFCNKTLWPLFHYFTTLARYEEEYWQEYKRVNALFADALERVIRPNHLLERLGE